MLGITGTQSIRYENGPILSRGDQRSLPEFEPWAFFRSENGIYEPQKNTMIGAPAIVFHASARVACLPSARILKARQVKKPSSSEPSNTSENRQPQRLRTANRGELVRMMKTIALWTARFFGVSAEQTAVSNKLRVTVLVAPPQPSRIP